MSRMRWMYPILVLSIAGAGLLSGCTVSPLREAAKGRAAEVSAAAPVKLRLAMWESDADVEFWMEKAKEYSKLKPNVMIDVEKVPDHGGQYLKVRLAANDMPDVMYLKPSHMQMYKQTLLPLDELSAAKKNTMPTRIDGRLLGAPLVSFSEYVYYHPSIFKKLQLQVPQTLGEFEELLAHIKERSPYIPLAIGMKDAWTSYPLMEFGMHILSGDEQYLASIAKSETPFGEGSSFHEAAVFISALASRKLAGPEPVSLTFDQATQLFESKQAAMIALGQWYYPEYMKRVQTDEDLAVFPLPWRKSTSEPVTAMTMADMNIAINKNSKHIEEAKAFFEWMFSKDVYQAYINKVQQTSTVEGVTADIPFFMKASLSTPFKPFIYYGTDERFSKMKGASQLDVTLAAQDLFSGKPLESIEQELNNKWRRAAEGVK